MLVLHSSSFGIRCSFERDASAPQHFFSFAICTTNTGKGRVTEFIKRTEAMVMGCKQLRMFQHAQKIPHPASSEFHLFSSL